MTRRILIAILALAAVPVLAQSASAHGRHGSAYEYRGTVTALTGDQLQVQVTGGNRPALRSLIGATQPTTFKVDATTKVVVDSPTGPGEGTIADLTPGDTVRVVYRHAAGLTAAQLSQTAATRVWDVTGKNRPAGRLFLYAGTVSAVDPATSAITATVDFGNWRALYSLLGQSTSQTFHYDAATVFVKWAAGKPYTVPATEVHVGDPVTVRILAPTWETPLATLLASPAYRIRVGEPHAAVIRAAQTDNPNG